MPPLKSFFLGNLRLRRMVSKVCLMPVLSSIVSYMSSPVLRSIETIGQPKAPICVDGTCYL